MARFFLKKSLATRFVNLPISRRLFLRAIVKAWTPHLDGSCEKRCEKSPNALTASTPPYHQAPMAESLAGLSSHSARNLDPPAAREKAAAAPSRRKARTAPTAESPEDVDAQLKFVEELAPYYRLADFNGEANDFMERLFDLWFIRWRLKLQDYGGSRKALDDGMRQKEAWIKEKLRSAASLAPEGHVGRSWHTHMKISERRQGVEAKKRKYRDYDDMRPQPRPRPKKVRTLPDDGAGAGPSSDDRIDMIPSSDDRIDATFSSDDLVAAIPSSDDRVDTIPSSDGYPETIPSSDDYPDTIPSSDN